MKIQLIRLHEKIAPSLALVALFATAPLHAQTAPPPSQTSQESSAQTLSADDLNDLLGPIALYPDALVALILPASTVPSDITLATRYLNQNGDDANVDDQPWDESVKGLARYPDVLKWMDDNLEWTNSLGEAFVEQPADVMNAIQALRGEAKAKGNLTNTPQQTVVVEKQTQEIRIVPTEPDVIYVPQYDPEIVYVRDYQPDYGPVLAFGAGFAVGAWLNYDCDWGGRGVYYGNDCGWNNHNRWNDRGYRDGNVNIVNTTVNNTNINNFTNNSNVNRWQASPNSRRQFTQRQRQNLGNARIARANAQVRHPNAQNGQHANRAAARPARVPKPGHINVANRKNNNVKHPNAAVRAPGAGNNGANAGKNQNNKNPNKGPNGNGSQANGKNKPGNPKRHNQPTTAAPAVNGQSGQNAGKNKHPNSSNKSPSVRAPGQNADKPKHKHKPSSAPSKSGGNNNPSKKPANHLDRPKQQPSKPSAAPQNKPHVQQQPKPQQHQQQPRPQQKQPKPQQAKPQQARPQQQKQPQVHQSQAKPKPQGGGSGQQQGNGGNKKKKKDKN